MRHSRVDREEIRDAVIDSNTVKPVEIVFKEQPQIARDTKATKLSNFIKCFAKVKVQRINVTFGWLNQRDC